MKRRGARCLKPQRALTLSAEEEYERAVMTWQLYDKTLWRLMSGEKEWMNEHFACPEQAREHMSECVLLFSDQIPCWLKVSPGRQMYCKHEVQSGKRKNYCWVTASGPDGPNVDESEPQSERGSETRSGHL